MPTFIFTYKRLAYLILPAILWLSGTHYAMGARLSESARALLRDCENSADLRKYDKMKQNGLRLRQMGEAEGSEDAKNIGETFILRSLICVHDTTDITARIGHIQELIEDAEKRKDYEALIYLCHPVGLYYHFLGNQFAQASLYAYKELDAARRLKAEEAEIIALNMLASIYFRKRDNSGLGFVAEAYNKSKKLGSQSNLYISACNYANYLYNENKFEQALQYLDEATEIAGTLQMESEMSYLDSFYGDIYSAMGNDKMAETFYLKSFAANPQTSHYDLLYARMSYASHLLRNGKYREALTELNKTLNLSKAYNIKIFDTHIYQFLSICEENLGNYPKALEYFKLFHEASDSLASEANSKEFAILDLRYRVSEEKRKNAAQQLQMMRRNWIIVSISALLVIIIVAGIIIWRRVRNRMRADKETVRRYLENLQTERNLRLQLEEAMKKSETQQNKSSITEGRRNELFASLKKLLEEEYIYRDKDLSLEKCASILGTNRTYLSQIVNEISGVSFPLFINSYRINEAIQLLSDPGNDEPLKSICFSVGFCATSSFYTLFKQKTGVAPSIFRRNVKGLSATQNDSVI